jgi:hypothetical protein
VLEREYGKSCAGKKQFTVEAEAQRKAAKSATITGEKFSAYKCCFGEHFHIGHTPDSVEARKERKERWRQRQKARKRLARENEAC